MTEVKTRPYPKALHKYELRHSDDEKRQIYACGMTHAYALSRECWPALEILSIDQLDDSWKS